MPKIHYFVLDETNSPIALVRFSEDNEVESVAPKVGDLLVGQQKKTVTQLLAARRWSLMTPGEWKEEYGG